MKLISFSLLVIWISLSACAAHAPSTAADPLTGRWEGTWGPSPERQTMVVLELKWDGSHLAGFVNPGARSAELQKASFNPTTNAITMELDVLDNSGGRDHYSIQGKVDGKKMTGTWTRKNGRGDFNITRN